MQKTLPLFSVLLVTATPALAQDYLGILNRTDTSFTSRGSNTAPNTNPSWVIERLDKEFYAGWGVDPANPGMRQIRGIHTLMQDQIGNTSESYSVLILTEGTAPNFPDVTTPIATAGPFPFPANTATGPIAYDITVTFATPVLTPSTGDQFLALDLPQPLVGNYPTDGLSSHALYYTNVTTSGFGDQPGASHPLTPPEQAGNGCWYVPSMASTLPVTYTTVPRMWKLEPIVGGAVGMAGTITNQTTAPLSNVAPGSSSQGSGLYPDAQNPPLTPGRVDDVASRWFKTGTPDNTPVFFLMDLGTFGPEIPLSSLLAGSTGVLCLNVPTMVVIGIGFTSLGEAYMTLSFSPAARTYIAGTSLLHQSAALDSTGVAHANPCSRQVL